MSHRPPLTEVNRRLAQRMTQIILTRVIEEPKQFEKNKVRLRILIDMHLGRLFGNVEFCNAICQNFLESLEVFGPTSADIVGNNFHVEDPWPIDTWEMQDMCDGIRYILDIFLYTGMSDQYLIGHLRHEARKAIRHLNDHFLTLHLLGQIPHSFRTTSESGLFLLEEALTRENYYIFPKVRPQRPALLPAHLR